MSCCGNTILKMPGDPSEKKHKKNIKLPVSKSEVGETKTDLDKMQDHQNYRLEM